LGGRGLFRKVFLKLNKNEMAEKVTIKKGPLAGMIIGLILFIGTIVTFPWAIKSVVDDVTHPPSETGHEITATDDVLVEPYTQLKLTILSMDEVNHIATYQISGFHHTHAKDPGYKEKLSIYQVDYDDAQGTRIPSSFSVDIPVSGQEFSSKFTLPLKGNIMFYPFDEYHLGLGIALQRIAPDGKVEFQTYEQTRGHLEIMVQEQIPRTDLKEYKNIDPKTVMPKKSDFVYSNAAIIVLNRPAYLKLVVVFVAFLTFSLALFTMITRPFDQLVLNAGALILGVWGARTLVLGGYPPDVTLIDTFLTATVLCMLLGLTFRSINHFHEQAGLRFIPWAKAKPKKEETKVCQQCRNKIPIEATRCGFCTSEVTT